MMIYDLTQGKHLQFFGDVKTLKKQLRTLSGRFPDHVLVISFLFAQIKRIVPLHHCDCFSTQHQSFL